MTTTRGAEGLKNSVPYLCAILGDINILYNHHHLDIYRIFPNFKKFGSAAAAGNTDSGLHSKLQKRRSEVFLYFLKNGARVSVSFSFCLVSVMHGLLFSCLRTVKVEYMVKVNV